MLGAQRSMTLLSKTFLRLLLLVVLLVAASAVSAQNFPTGLLNAVPHAAEKLSSDDVNERVSLLEELLKTEPENCTLGFNLAFDLTKEDYAFVVAKILEKDLRTLDEKTAGSTWYVLSYLIQQFQMKEFAPQVAVYLGEGYMDDQQNGIRYSLIQALGSLKAKEFDSQIALYVRTPSLEYQALNTLIAFKSRKAVTVLLEKLADEKSKYWALERLVEIGAVEAGP
jgi:hypothetical protein